MNPLGLVPTLEDGDYTLFESNAILRYLCNTRDAAGAFYPLAPRARGAVDAWLDMQQIALGPPHGVVFSGLVRTPAEKRDHAAIGAAITEAGAIWSLLDARLAAHPYVAGDQFGVADIAFGVHAHRWFVMPIARPDSPHLHAWYHRLLKRPPYATHVAQPLT
jgi:glutathione S-transferase